MKIVKNANEIRNRNFELSTIQKRLIVNERSKNNKYSNKFSNEIDWNKNNYLIRFLCDFKYFNVKNIKEIFYEIVFN